MQAYTVDDDVRWPVASVAGPDTSYRPGSGHQSVVHVSAGYNAYLVR